MDNPIIADKKPAVMTLEPGEYWWCACGRSKGQPFCDGAHKGTAFSPTRFQVAEKSKLVLCNCKITKTAPFCDGAHKTLK